MKEREALEQSLQHWQANLDKVKSLRMEELSAQFGVFTNAHALANAVFGIAIDVDHCAMCQFCKNDCGRCVLWDGGVCCEGWRQVYACLNGMLLRKITEQSIRELIVAINSICARLEYELGECR